MNYKSRLLEKKVIELTGKFPAILITGARQTGKTSMFNQIARTLYGDQAQTIAFDTPSEIDAFRRDPNLFFQNHPNILFLDEIQQVPDIFPFLKREIDQRPGTFRFFLSGSQHFDLMKGVTESLAGRTAILDLWPFAVQEILSSESSLAEKTISYLEQPAKLNELIGRRFPINDNDDVVPAMLTGGYPPVALDSLGGDWLEAYRRTYIQRDIRQLSQVADLGRFDRFLTLCAGRSGTIINKVEFSRALSVDGKTVDHWLSLLENSYQIISLPAYHVNSTKRVVKRPKWIFADIGLALHLQAIRDSQALKGAPHFGNLFESFAIMEIRKLYGHTGQRWDGYFWRTSYGLECDLVLPVAGKLVPIEIKHTASPATNDLISLNSFLDTYKEIAPLGILISMNPRVEKLSARIYNLPLGLILKGLAA